MRYQVRTRMLFSTFVCSLLVVRRRSSFVDFVLCLCSSFVVDVRSFVRSFRSFVRSFRSFVRYRRSFHCRRPITDWFTRILACSLNRSCSCSLLVVAVAVVADVVVCCLLRSSSLCSEFALLVAVTSLVAA